MVPVPMGAAREDITAKIEALAKAIESHKDWTPPRPHPSLFQVWDFVKRSHYIMTELENIRTGKEIKYPDQIPPNSGAKDNQEKAQMSFTDVVTRTLTINEIINKPQMMAVFGQPAVEFGDDVKAKAQAAQEAIMSLPE